MIISIPTSKGKGGRPKKVYEIYIDGELIRIGTQHRLYNIRYKMIERCYNAKPADFNSYQGKGIKVCEDWRINPESFFKFCLAAGWKQGMHIDRIDPLGNYEPTNVQISTAYENNKRANAGRVGERSANVKITEAQAKEIKKLLRDKLEVCKIRDLLGLSKDIIADIKRGKTWKHLDI